VPEEFSEDFVKKSCWDLFICKRASSNVDIVDNLLGSQTCTTRRQRRKDVISDDELDITDDGSLKQLVFYDSDE
jgi:hypothetical protein